jgi:hypothetical protein
MMRETSESPTVRTGVGSIGLAIVALGLALFALVIVLRPARADRYPVIDVTTGHPAPDVEHFCLAKIGYRKNCAFVKRGTVIVNPDSISFRAVEARGEFEEQLPNAIRRADILVVVAIGVVVLGLSIHRFGDKLW